MSTDDKKAVVTSYNQSGGITAHTVNLGPPARHVAGTWLQWLNDRIPTGSKVEVEVVMGDSEAVRFAHEIEGYLQQTRGCTITTFAQSMIPGDPAGQQITRRDDGSYHVIVGAHP